MESETQNSGALADVDAPAKLAAHEAVERMLEQRKGNVLPDGVTIRELMTYGRERHHSEFFTSLDDAEASLDRGEGISITPESMRALTDDVKRSGRVARKVTEMSAEELEAIGNTEMDARHNHLDAELGEHWV